jgi:hypothetical protein
VLLRPALTISPGKTEGGIGLFDFEHTNDQPADVVMRIELDRKNYVFESVQVQRILEISDA